MDLNVSGILETTTRILFYLESHVKRKKAWLVQGNRPSWKKNTTSFTHWLVNSFSKHLLIMFSVSRKVLCPKKPEKQSTEGSMSMTQDMVGWVDFELPCDRMEARGRCRCIHASWRTLASDPHSFISAWWAVSVCTLHLHMTLVTLYFHRIHEIHDFYWQFIICWHCGMHFSYFIILLLLWKFSVI